MQVTLSPDSWLSTILTRPVFKLSEPNDDATEVLLTAIDNELSRLPARSFVYAKVDTKKIGIIHALEQAHFSLIETNVLFDKIPAIESKFLLASNLTLRFAGATDEEACATIARDAFTFTRFHTDPKIDTATANYIKQEWVRNFFKGTRGQYMVVAELAGEVVGFLQLLKHDKLLTIDLIGVSATSRRQGVARQMIQFAESEINAWERYLVGTQVANTASIRLYESLGFRLCSSAYTFHYHAG